MAQTRAASKPARTAPRRAAPVRQPAAQPRAKASVPAKAPAKSAKAAPQPAKPPRAPRSAPAAAPAVEAKPAKTKLVRDSFTIPKSEYTVLVALKERAIGLAHGAKKSELLRAGIQALSALGDAAFLAALKAVPSIKTGRPKSRKASDA